MKIYSVIVERLNDDGSLINEVMHVAGDSVLSVAQAVQNDLLGFDNAKVSGAGTASAGLPGYAAGGNGEMK